MRKQKCKEQECLRRYYFFDYLFWLGEITWENYHKVNFKQLSQGQFQTAQRK